MDWNRQYYSTVARIALKLKIHTLFICLRQNFVCWKKWWTNICPKYTKCASTCSPLHSSQLDLYPLQFEVLFKVLNKNGHLDKYLVSIAMDIGSETAKWRCGFFEIYSNTPIPNFVKEWLSSVGIKFIEFL